MAPPPGGPDAPPPGHRFGSWGHRRVVRSARGSGGDHARQPHSHLPRRRFHPPAGLRRLQGRLRRIEATGVVPVIHQIELHPYFQQRELRAFHDEHRILTQAWGPLGQGRSDLLENEAITAIAQAHGATPAQVVLAWHLARGIVAIPKSVTPSRIVENLGSVQLRLAEDELVRIDELDRADGRAGRDPADSGH
ncbi:aldo/keto reductase [Brachybacterium sp. Marseille-Q2903]|uniref:Aldo/keto reductase n=1 Tax=Brachybacterium epidermidis TaxID=2781983 RepID=A0ABR9VYT6_9MICO|nr:aldo/keto reductase [Brachybacterium epidermidis]